MDPIYQEEEEEPAAAAVASSGAKRPKSLYELMQATGRRATVGDALSLSNGGPDDDIFRAQRTTNDDDIFRIQRTANDDDLGRRRSVHGLYPEEGSATVSDPAATAVGQYNRSLRANDPPSRTSQSAAFNEVKQSMSSFIEQLDKDNSLSEYAVPSNSKTFGMDRDYRSTRDIAPAIYPTEAVQSPFNLETELQSISIDGSTANLNSDPHQQIHSTTIAPTHPTDELEIPSYSTSILDQDVDLAAIFGAESWEAVATATAADSCEPSTRQMIERCDEDKGQLLRHHTSSAVQAAAHGLLDDQLLFESRSMKNRIVALEKQNKQLSKQLEEAQAEIQRLYQSNDRLVADTASKIEQERSRYRADLTQLSSKHSEEVQSKQQLHEKLEHLHELKSDYETLLAEKHGLEAKVDKARDDSVGVRNDLSNAKAELSKVKAELQRVRVELEESKADSSGLRVEGSRLVKELGDARLAADQQVREWGGEKKWLEEQLQALRQDLNDRVQVIGRMNNELMGLRQDSNAVQQRAASSGEQLGRELQQAQQLISSLERELRDTREGMTRRGTQNPTGGNPAMPASSSLATHPYHSSIDAHSSTRSSINDGYNANIESSNHYRNMNSSAETSNKRSSSATSLASVVTTRGGPSTGRSSESSTSYDTLRPADHAFRSPHQSAYVHSNSATTITAASDPRTSSSMSVAYHADQPFGIDKSTSLSSLIDSRRASSMGSASRHAVSSSYSDAATAQYAMNSAVVRSPFATEATSALINQRFDNLDRVLTTLMTEKTTLQDEAERYISIATLPYPTLGALLMIQSTTLHAGSVQTAGEGTQDAEGADEVPDRRVSAVGAVEGHRTGQEGAVR